MTIKICLEYNASQNEWLELAFGEKHLKMNEILRGLWQIEIENTDLPKDKKYSFEVHSEEQCLRKEWKCHKIDIPASKSVKELIIRDKWIDRPNNSPFYSSVFT